MHPGGCIYICDIYIYIHALLSFLYVFWIPTSCHSRSNTIKTINIILHTIHSICTTIHKHTHTELSISTCIGQHIGPVVGFLTSGAVIPFGPSPQVLFLGLLHLPSPLTQQTSMLQNDKWICSATLQPPKTSWKSPQIEFKHVPSEKEGIWFKGPWKQNQ